MKIGFLTYLPRSGSTLIANYLNKFDQVMVIPESRIIDKFFIFFNEKSLITKKQLFLIINQDLNDYKSFIKYFKINDLDKFFQKEKYSFYEILKSISLFIVKKNNLKSIKLTLFKRDGVTYYNKYLKINQKFYWVYIYRNLYEIYLSQINNKKFDGSDIYKGAKKFMYSNYEFEKSYFIRKYKNQHVLSINYNNFILKTNEINNSNFFGIKLTQNSEFNKCKLSLITTETKHLHLNINKKPQVLSKNTNNNFFIKNIFEIYSFAVKIFVKIF